MDGFRQISDCLPAWLIAEGQKRTASAKPAAKSREETKHPSPSKRPVLRLIQGSRCKPVHDPRRAPPRRTGFHLMLVWSNGHAASAPESRSRDALSRW